MKTTKLINIDPLHSVQWDRTGAVIKLWKREKREWVLAQLMRENKLTYSFRDPVEEYEVHETKTMMIVKRCL